MRLPLIPASLLAVCLLAVPLTAPCQSRTPATVNAPPPPPSTLVQDALSDVQGTTSALDIARWRASRSMRKAAQQDVDSIQRDLGDQIPGLIAQADGAPGSVPRSFRLYRNVGALYDVLLRVSRTADISAPHSEAEAVLASLEHLERAENALGNQILQVATQNETRLTLLERAEAAGASSRTTGGSFHETIVTDGPASPARHRETRRAGHKKAAEHQK